MTTLRHPRSVRRILSLLEDVPLPRPAAILVAGSEGEAIAAALAASGHRLHTGDPIAPHTLPRESLDLAIVVSPLADDPWDRWTLQQVHAALKPTARLVFAAPNTLDPASLIDPRYLGEKLAKQVRKWAPGLGGSGSVAPPAGRRTYTRSQVDTMIEGLGYRIERRLQLGPWGVGSPAGLGAYHVVLGRRIPSLFGLDPDRPYPEPTEHGRRFETEHAAFLRARDQWAERFLPAPAPPAEPIVPEPFRGRNVLVLAPHPDDEIIGCGGTLLRLAEGGARVTVLQATDGCASAALVGAPEAIRRRVRLDEAAAVARAAGFEPTLFWREDNDAFRSRPDLAERLRGSLDALQPALVFTPFFTDVHPDHVAVNRLLAMALDEWTGGEVEVVCYEVWSRVPANRYCEVTGHMRRVEELLWMYGTAMKVEDYVAHCAARNYYNAIRCTGRAGFVEAFHQVPAGRFRALMAGMHGAAPEAARDVPVAVS